MTTVAGVLITGGTYQQYKNLAISTNQEQIISKKEWDRIESEVMRSFNEVQHLEFKAQVELMKKWAVLGGVGVALMDGSWKTRRNA